MSDRRYQAGSRGDMLPFDRSNIYICIPTYCEKQSIEAVIRGLFACCGDRIKVIVVDDSSPDGTSEVVKRLSRQFPVHLICRDRKGGIGSAYVEGFRYALSQGASVICQMDGDLSHDPVDLTRLLDALDECDVVVGSRWVPGGRVEHWGAGRQVISHLARMLSRVMLGTKIRDATSGYRCFRRSVFDQINLSEILAKGYVFQEEMAARCQWKGLHIKEVPIAFRNRVNGRSKLTSREAAEFLVRIVKLRCNRWTSHRS